MVSKTKTIALWRLDRVERGEMGHAGAMSDAGTEQVDDGNSERQGNRIVAMSESVFA